jgi:hypothetical protein
MERVRLRNPYEIPLYIFSVLVNLLIIGFILAGALLLGYVNALVGEPLSGPMVNVIVAAFVALFRSCYGEPCDRRRRDRRILAPLRTAGERYDEPYYQPFRRLQRHP